MKFLRAATIAALFLFAGPGPVHANDVTLTSRDGAIELSGMLLGYDGEFYRIDTEYGILTVDGSGVNCDGPGCPNLGAFVAEFGISGARAMGSVLMPALIEGFALRQGYALKREELPAVGLQYTLYDEPGTHPAARITIRLTSSTEGFADLLGEQTDIVLSLREVDGRERAMAREAGLGDLRAARQSRVLALDALVPIIAPGNPVRRLSMVQLAAIYSGKITRWAELGGEDAPITLYLQDRDTGFGQVFFSRVVSALGSTLSDQILYQPTGASLVRAVSTDPFGIGIASYSQTGNGKVVTLSGDCGFELVADPMTIKAEDYPLTAPMYLYLPARRLPRLARDFLVYLRSEAAQLVIRRVGLVDQTLGDIPVDAQGRRLANAISAAGDEVSLDDLRRMATLLTSQDRLTLTFRFEGGSTALDAPSRSNISLLAHALESGRFDGRILTFVGFSDGQGAAATNLRLAKKRAEAVRKAVLTAAETLDTDSVTLNTDAFGEALPMACDDSAWGRRVNRRVEVWVE